MRTTTTIPPPNSGAQTPHRAEPAKIWKARSYIEEHLDEVLSLTRVASFVEISANHLSEKFKEITGVKFVDYIARRRFVKTCQLLPNRQLRISEIAFEVGFQSLSQFNRVFKRLSGLSPTDFRARQKTEREGDRNLLPSRNQSRQNFVRKNA